MIKKINKIFKKKFFNQILFYFFQKKYKIILDNSNFQNIFFENLNELKKIYLSKIFFRTSLINDNDYQCHSFNFINVGRVLGGEQNVNLCKKYIFKWNKTNYSKISEIWSNKIVTKRFINLVYNYDFYAISASKEEVKKINKIILKHYFLIVRHVEFSDISKLSIEDIKAYYLGSFISDDSKRHSLDLILNLIKSQVDINGFHKSYNPLEHAMFINNLYEIKSILLFFTKSDSKDLNFHILNMTSLLINLIHKDGSIALFNGSNNYKINEINNIIKLSKDIKIKEVSSVENGLAIYASKNKKVYLEVVKPTSSSIYQKIHAGTLSFEFSFLNEKIITNCGSIDTQLNSKSQYLKFSAAHSTIILNNTNVFNLSQKNYIKELPKTILHEAKNNIDHIIWTSSHDGYLKRYNKIIKREIYIYKDMDKISGKDIILNTKINSKKDIYTIRFHLMPKTISAISNNKKTVFIKTKKNQSWIFKSESRLSIENSIYINNENKIEQSKQIVINGIIKDKNITEEWTLYKA